MLGGGQSVIQSNPHHPSAMLSHPGGMILSLVVLMAAVTSAILQSSKESMCRSKRKCRSTQPINYNPDVDLPTVSESVVIYST